MVRGLEGAEEQLRIALGAGALPLPPLRTNKVRLHLSRPSNPTPSHGEFVPLARFTGGGGSAAVSGAVLMPTIFLQGFHTLQNDVEMGWWALTSQSAQYNNCNSADRLLLGTGMEDFFMNSFTLSRLSRTYHNDDAGLTHVHGGPQDMCPDKGGSNFTTCADQFQMLAPARFSAYRFFVKDPLVFDDRLELSVR